MLLQFEGYQVHAADNGHAALEIFQPEKFALIFTDFEMPGMNGHELASIIKARDLRSLHAVQAALSCELTMLGHVGVCDVQSVYGTASNPRHAGGRLGQQQCSFVPTIG